MTSNPTTTDLVSKSSVEDEEGKNLENLTEEDIMKRKLMFDGEMEWETTGD